MFDNDYYINECNKIISGKKLTACIKTFGCQMNAHDSEILTDVLIRMGYTPIEDENADFVIYNTCTVRENANTKVYGHLGLLKKLKESNPNMIVAICGCMMQEPLVVEKIRKSYNFVDIIFGTHNLYKFSELVYRCFEKRAYNEAHPIKKDNRLKVKHSLIVEVLKEAETEIHEMPNEGTAKYKRNLPFMASVNIMYGCNNFCSYCIVPYVRGRERSRKPEDILAEVKALVADGVIEIMLLGQNVNSYGKTLAEPVSFAKLLEMVCSVEGLKRVRFMTSHPKDLSDELIDVMARNKKVCRHLHLPVQSGSSEILRKMNRRYTGEQYLDLVDRIRSAIPDISLTTDIIVGFPGESEQDFEDTLSMVRKVRYDSAYTFQYSKRTGTPAAAMEDQIPEDVVTERYDRLMKLVSDISAENAGKREGSIAEVLVEGINEQNNELLTGRMSNNMLVHFKGDESVIGTLVNVKLTECKGFYYMGTLL